MYSTPSKKFNKEITVIHPGEFHVSGEDKIISTLLGSCVAVCLHDPVNSVSGMNHFMLPGRITKSDIINDDYAKYGTSAIYNLLLQLYKHGAKKENLIAKIFGGGHVLDKITDKKGIPFDNIRVAKLYMEIEDIPIVDIDVGDKFTRKIFMDVRSGKVFLKKTTKAEVINLVVQRELDFSINRFA
ncbi:MAG: chemotaxis protein CheD [Spirochaetes bacterium]|nr:chemotaxis protein CheD [Spirochaetota bacterium]